MLDAVSSTVTSAARSASQAIATSVASPAAAAQPAEELGFDTVLKQVTADAITTLKAGESASIASIQGKESTRRVVEALMSAERALQTAVAVRDKVVQAYQEVTRMSI